MADTIITTKTCKRCAGTGQHSFNLKDGTRCYGCGGTGRVAMAPKGQKKIKPTVDDYRRAYTGDIVEIACVLYRVGEIRWIKSTVNANQRVELTRLIDGKAFTKTRMFHGYDPSARSWSRSGDGPWQTFCCNIHTPEELIGTLYTPDQYSKACMVTAPEGFDPFNA